MWGEGLDAQATRTNSNNAVRTVRTSVWRWQGTSDYLCPTYSIDEFIFLNLTQPNTKSTDLWPPWLYFLSSGFFADKHQEDWCWKKTGYTSGEHTVKCFCLFSTCPHIIQHMGVILLELMVPGDDDTEVEALIKTQLKCVPARWALTVDASNCHKWYMIVPMLSFL